MTNNTLNSKAYPRQYCYQMLKYPLLSRVYFQSDSFDTSNYLVQFDFDTNAGSLLRSKKNDANDDKITATDVLQNSRELKANEEVPNDSYVYIIQNQKY